MTNGWTPERKARQAELIRNWRPWEQSTGPRTVAGKARTARNRYRGAQRARLRNLAKELRAFLKAQREWLERVALE